LNLAAKWSKQLYEESRTEIANVAVPKKELETLLSSDTKTPGTTVTKNTIAVPTVITKTLTQPSSVIDYVSKYSLSGGIISSRETKAKIASEFVPIAVTEETVKAPEYQPTISYTAVTLPFGVVKVPTVTYNPAGSTAIEDTTGVRYTTFKASDFKTDITTTDLPTVITDLINYEKENIPGKQEYWEQPTFGDVPIDIPQFPDILGGLSTIGKYALLAIAVILGISLLKDKKK